MQQDRLFKDRDGNAIMSEEKVCRTWTLELRKAENMREEDRCTKVSESGSTVD